MFFLTLHNSNHASKHCYNDDLKENIRIFTLIMLWCGIGLSMSSEMPPHLKLNLIIWTNTNENVMLLSKSAQHLQYTSLPAVLNQCTTYLFSVWVLLNCAEKHYDLFSSVDQIVMIIKCVFSCMCVCLPMCVCVCVCGRGGAHGCFLWENGRSGVRGPP